MMKFLVFFCLFAGTFAARKAFFETPSGCTMHVRIEDPNKPQDAGEYYFSAIWGTSYYYKFIRDDGYQLLCRRDIKEEGNSFRQVVLPNGTCQESFSYCPSPPYSGGNSMYYDDEQYPEPVDCPDSRTGCMKYCSDSQPTSCIIVDADGFIAQNEYGYNYIIYDPPSMEVFNVTKCDGSSTLPVSYDFCELAEIPPQFSPKCSYHMKEYYPDSPEMNSEYYVMMTPDGSRAQYLKRIRGDETKITRCDSHGTNCFGKVMKGGNCEDKPSTYMDAPFFGYQFLYDSANYPKETNCPDGNPGCFKYCSVFGDSCLFYDGQLRLVQTPSMSSYYTFFDDLPTMDMFEFESCDGSTTYPAPADLCAVQEEFVPKFPDCSFNFSVDKKDILTRRNNGEIRDDPTLHYDLSGIMVDGEPLIMKVKMDSSYNILRCDKKNAHGNCYIQKGEPCKEPYYTSYYYYSHYSDLPSYSLMAPSAFMYNKTAYPVNVNCLDGSDGCKQYCDFNGKCYIANSAGYVVQDPDLTNWTFFDEFSFDEFEMDTCDGKTHIPAPDSHMCDKPVVPSSSSSTTPSPASRTSSSRVVSSASVVKSTFTFVAIAAALALF